MPVPMCDKGAFWTSGENRWDGRKHVCWPDGTPKPRTCSHCGSVHPEDLLFLLEQGWEIEQTDKCYKYYVHPLGHQEEVYRLAHAITEGKAEAFVGKVPTVAPCVKLYMNHVDTGMQEKLNNAISQFVEKEKQNDQSK